MEAENGSHLPDVYNISWVTPKTLCDDDISISASTISKSPTDPTDRVKILYQYDKDSQKRDFVITVPRDPAAFITCRGVAKDMFTRGDTKIETNRYGAQFVLDGNNKYHIELYAAFAQVIAKIKDITGTDVTFPIKDMEGYSILYTNLIHANDGRMFSSAYTADEQLDILNVRKCKSRPAFLLSMIKKSSKETKIRVQLSQIYVHEEIKNFPLANRD
jgi:hypothetical protein